MKTKHRLALLGGIAVLWVSISTAVSWIGCTWPVQDTCAVKMTVSSARFQNTSMATLTFLSALCSVDGASGLRRRHATASKYLGNFDVAFHCGFGRQPGQDGRETMREHRQA